MESGAPNGDLFCFLFLGSITISHFILFCWKENRRKLLVSLNCLCWLEVFVFLGCIDYSITIAHCNPPNLQDVVTLHFWSIIMSCPKQVWWSSIHHWPSHQLVYTLVITISTTSTTVLPLILITWYWNVISFGNTTIDFFIWDAFRS
jgi:hypothetical protein